jgi:hypothetical protein
VIEVVIDALDEALDKEWLRSFGVEVGTWWVPVALSRRMCCGQQVLLSRKRI